MGMADVAVVLWTQFLKHYPADPSWFNRDRFVLSAGHGSMLLYSLLHLSGYDLSIDDLKQFRQLHSRTPGHPEQFMTPGVETTTGPLGQGISNAVGMALAERHLSARFNFPGFPIIDHYTYVIASDGDLMEGISYEACSLAGHWKLGRLMVLYDDNKISIDGATDLAFTENVRARFEAQGWHTQAINGHDPIEIAEAITQAQAETDRPSLIACRTHIGYGSPNKQDTASSHGSPLGIDEVERTKTNLGWPLEPLFHVPAEVYTYMQETAHPRAYADWQSEWAAFADAHPRQADMLDSALHGTLPAGWDDDFPLFEARSAFATRAASGKVLETLKTRLPLLVGGSADLTGSNKTVVPDDFPFQHDAPTGRYLHFGVREHAMAAILNGLNLHGGLRGYGGTFLIFSDYMRNSIRLSALMNVPTLFVFTHDSIGLGEDGPTHQPIEQLASLRAIPNLNVFRPADANETALCWQAAIRSDGPSALALTRQKVPTLDPATYPVVEGAARGAYVLSDANDPQVLLLATGSEVQIAMDAQKQLADEGIASRVVSMPCWKLFDAQPETYRNAVLPPAIKARVSIEAGVTLGWSRYIGDGGVAIGLDTFGASAPAQILYEHFGLTSEAVVDAAHESLNRTAP